MSKRENTYEEDYFWKCATAGVTMENTFLFRDLSVTNETVSRITDRGSMYLTKVLE